MTANSVHKDPSDQIASPNKPTTKPGHGSNVIRGCASAILALQNVQGTLECYSKLKDKLGLKTSR